MGKEQLVTDKAAKICKEKSMSGFEPRRAVLSSRTEWSEPRRDSCDCVPAGAVKSEPLGGGARVSTVCEPASPRPR